MKVLTFTNDHKIKPFDEQHWKQNLSTSLKEMSKFPYLRLMAAKFDKRI